MVLPIAVTFIFFSDDKKWKLYTPISFIIGTLGVFEFDKFYNQNFQIKDFNHFFSEQEYTGYIYESITFLLLISIYILIQSYYTRILKKKEKELSIFKKIFDNSQEGVAIVDLDFKYLKQNAAHESILEFTGQEMKGKTPEILLGEEGLRRVGQQMARSNSFAGEIEYKSKSGLKHIDLMTFSIKEQNEVTCHVGIIRDITKQKNLQVKLESSERKYRALVNLMGEGLGVVDAEEKIIFVNPYLENIFEVEEGGLLGRNLFEFVDNPQAEVIKKQSAIRKSGTSSSYKLRILVHGNKEKTVQVTAAPYFDGKDVAGTIAVVVDVSEREKIHKALIKSEANLQKVNHTKDKLFSIIAHDLRSPFNGILGYSNLLVENMGKLETDKLEKFAEAINSSAKNTLVLLDNLLNWAKTQTGKIDFNPEYLNLKEVFEEMIPVSKMAADIKSITIDTSALAEIEVYADKDMLKTIFRNLISNAIKFTPVNGQVRLVAKMEANGAQVSVHDTGVGMDEETLKSLFNVSNTKTTLGTANEKGSGLGLALCFEFVKKHNGNIRVQSKKNQGSQFTVNFPNPNI